MNNAKINTHLENVKDLQMAFKSQVVKNVARNIVEVALIKGHLWPDDIDTSNVEKQDKNCIGSVYRWLCNINVLVRGGEFRRSKSDGSRGRTIFKYHLVSRSKANAFLRANGMVVKTGQLDLI